MILSNLTNKITVEVTIPESFSRDKQQEDFVFVILVLEYMADWLLFLPKVRWEGKQDVFCLGDDCPQILTEPEVGTGAGLFSYSEQIWMKEHCTFIVLVARGEYNSLSYF